MRAVERSALVSLLDADASLAEALAPEELDAARLVCLAPVAWLSRGPWDPVADAAGGHDLGFLVLDGFVTREVDVLGHPAVELLGPGDFLRPAEPDRTAPFRSAARWTALEPCRLAVLDERVCSIVGRWPHLLDALVGRALARSREQAFVLAVGRLRGIELRLLVVLWHVGLRWCDITGRETVVPVHLTHSILAHLASAQRPSVSRAMSALQRRGLIAHDDDGHIVLLGEPPLALTELRRALA